MNQRIDDPVNPQTIPHYMSVYEISSPDVLAISCEAEAVQASVSGMSIN
jgi:hypothetical protein